MILESVAERGSKAMQANLGGALRHPERFRRPRLGQIQTVSEPDERTVLFRQVRDC
jgi:hypothetical protein